VGFDSFWDVYKLLCDAVDSEYLFQSSVGVFDEENTSKDSNVDQRPLRHLRACEFGQDGIPAGISEEEAEEQGMIFQESSLHMLTAHYAIVMVEFKVEFTDDEGDEIF
jgi:hypothetical protein